MAFLVIAVISPSYVVFGSGLSPSIPPVQVRDSETTSSLGFPPTNETTVMSLTLEEKDLALILLSAETSKSMRDSIDFIRGRGGEVLHIFPTHVLVGRIPRSLRDTLVGKSGIEQVAYSIVDPSVVAGYGENAVIAVEAWNNNFMGQAASKGLEPSLGFAEPPPIKDDMRMAPQSASESSKVPAPPYGAGFYDTSEYMIGDISVAIILPESNGAIDPNQENWTSGDRSAVISEIQAAMNWWAAREPNAHLSFTYTFAILATSYEPIHRPSTDEGLWIAEVMQDIGYTSGDYFYRVRSFLTDLRNGDGTDWAITIFVAHSYWDVDGCFSDGYFAYAYLGGPFIVMTYDNNGYGLANMDAVTAHEFGHSFYALDQYTSAQQPCTYRSGYLNVENQNSAYPSEGSCLSNVPSIMRGQVSPYTSGAIDQYARQQVGWRDSDGDGRLDIVDFFPQNTLNPYSPDPTSDSTPTYSGQASSRACYPNNNPYGQRHDITINTITGVQFWVEDTYGNTIRPTQDATPTDGRFDSDLEGYTFTVTPELSPGTYRFASVAWNNQGNGLIVWDVLTIESPVTVTITKTLTESSTSYLYRTSTTTVTSYTTTTTSTSTIPTVTTVVLVPLTITSTEQSTQFLTSVLTTTVTDFTSTTTSTSTIPTTVALVPLTMTSTAQSTQLLTSILTTTVTSYTGTQTSTSTIVVPTTVVLVPSTVTSTVQSTQYLTSILTTTVTSYTSTWTSTSTIPTVTTVVLVPSTVTSTTQGTQYLTSILTTTVTNYTSTTTSTSTSVVYTTVTASPGGAGPAGAGASSSMAYPAFITALAIMTGHRVTAGRPKRVPKVRAVSSPVQSYSVLGCHRTLAITNMTDEESHI